MNVESVELNDDNAIVCPECGSVIFTSDDGFDVFCSHVEFVYLHSVGEFVFSSDRIEKNEDKVRKILEESDWDAGERFLPKNMTILDYTETGMCCGPCSFTTYVGITKDVIKKAKKKAKK